MVNTRIERVLRHDGIVAVLDWFTDQAWIHDPRWVGDPSWLPIVYEAVKLRQLSGESAVRVLVGQHAVLISGDESHVVGIVFIKGHPVVKSVVRMVRQLLRAPASVALSQPKAPPFEEAPGGPSSAPSAMPPGADPRLMNPGDPGPFAPGARGLHPVAQDPGYAGLGQRSGPGVIAANQGPRTGPRVGPALHASSSTLPPKGEGPDHSNS